MPNFAICDGSTIVNVIVADTQQIAEDVTGMTAIETTGDPWIGWVLVDGVWTDPNPPTD